MSSVEYQLNDIVRMKKPHACGENQWQVIRLGMDIRIKCQKCGHSVLIPRARFDRLIRKVLVPSERRDNHEDQNGLST
ncbi:DUF951 domain-containing protein [Alicyclobacillus dauci]|uniref:DUF951 domain-containing protein n=1 Tax=Alicyclobacillus dauci TaxID=1475485 RepID=A0ABY6Z393_9BACL|nr:DUF951 domain-containing protein [Alicyclobacillus dauci]WAH36993.1 DUF951 domain-containing protein [Alicyclobacillus dauci]